MPVIDTQHLTKLYYSIGELAEMLDVNASLLRFWEKEFNLKVSKRNKKGNRLYSVKEIEEINKIYALVKVQLFTLDGAKKAIKTKDKSLIFDAKQTVASKLDNIKTRLLKLKS
ncbi:MAG: transcriptional regulator [Crocinitomicaceae bacterium TMED16]|nr:MerR family transcriptional regulator [Crocinitomicaceae bacterium]OUT70477.1 MAG: transcriptional regulator [Crocinitomicaceae bacterium TMED16]